MSTINSDHRDLSLVLSELDEIKKALIKEQKENALLHAELEHLRDEKTLYAKIKSVNPARSYLDKINAEISVHDINKFVTYQNEKHIQTWGNCVGKKCYQAYLNLDQPCAKCDFPNKTLTDKSFTVIHKQLMKDNTSRFMEISSYPLFDSKGNVSSVINFARELSDNKSAAESILDLQRHQQAILNTLPDLVWFVDKDSKFIVINEALANTFKVDPLQIIGKTLFEYFPKEMAEKEINENNEIYKTGKTLKKEEMQTGPNGEPLWVELIKIPAYDNRNECIGIIGTARDITLRKQFEDKIVANEERLRNLLDNLKNGVCRTTPKNGGHFVEANKAMEVITGYSREELMTIKVEDLYADPDERRAYIKNFKNSKEPFRHEIQMRQKNGSIIYTMLTATPVFDQQGNHKYIDAICENISEKRNFEQALVESERRFREFAKLLPVTAFEADISGNLIYFNETLVTTFGYQYSDTFGKNVFNYLVPEDRLKAINNLHQVISGKYIGMNEYRAIKKNGERFPVLIQTSPIISTDGKNMGFRGIIVDITKQKNIENELRESEIRFRMLAENANDMIYRISVDETPVFDYVSPASLKITGYAPEEFYRDPDIFANNFLSVDFHKESVNVESNKSVTQNTSIRWKHKKGNTICLELNETISKNKNGIIIIEGIARDITDKVEATEALRASEKKYRQLVEQLQEGIGLTDEKLNITYANPRLSEITGYSVSEMCGKTPFDFVPKELKKTLITNFSILKEKHYLNIDIQLTRKNNTTVDTNLSVSAIMDDAGAFMGTLAVIQDITDRKKAEAQLRYHAMLADNVSDAFISSGLDSKVISWNKTAEKIYGWKAEEIIGKYLPDIIKVQIVDRSEKGKLDNISSSGFWEGESIQERKDGTKINIWGKLSYIHDENGNNIGLVSLNRDITERKKNQETILKNEARLESLLKLSQHKFENINDLFDIALKEALHLTASATGYIMLYNGERNEITMRSFAGDNLISQEQSYPGKTFKLEELGILVDAIRTNSVVIINDFNQYYASNKKRLPETHVAIHSFLSIPIFFEDKIVATVGVGNKTTEYDQSDVRQLTLLFDSVWKIVDIKKAEEERKLAALRLAELYSKEKTQREELEAEAKSRGMFIDILAHELRTPLTPIVASISMLKDIATPNTDPIQNRLIDNIAGSADTLAQRLEDLLDIARYSRGTFKLHKVPVNMHNFITNIIDRFRPSFEQNKQPFKVNITDVLPEMEVDMQKFEQVIVNLLSNAAKFSQNKGEVSISACVSDNKLTIDVIDHGIGISQEEQSRLFEPYHRVEQDRQKFPGIGLGLAVSKQIVEAHGGKITVKSQPNNGSTFTINLPLNGN